MEKIINNAGYQHLTEEIFWNLDFDDLKICAQINGKPEQDPVWNRTQCLRKEKDPENWVHFIFKHIFYEMDPDITHNNNEMDPVLNTISLQRRSDLQNMHV